MFKIEIFEENLAYVIMKFCLDSNSDTSRSKTALKPWIVTTSGTQFLNI